MAHHLNSDNDEFFKEILISLGNKINILLVYFAKELDRIDANREEDEAQFIKATSNGKIFFEVANEVNFEEQVKNSDVIYLHGGNTLKLLETLKKFPNLKSIFEGKVIAGESAGSYVLSSYFYSKTIGAFMEGLGMVPVRTICHYIEMNSEKLDKGPKDMEKLLLPDYVFKVFNL